MTNTPEKFSGVNLRTALRDWFRENGLRSDDCRNLHVEGVSIHVDEHGNVYIQSITLLYKFNHVQAHARATFGTREDAVQWVRKMDHAAAFVQSNALPRGDA